MTLIFILIALAVDLLSVDLERLRKFDWLMSLYDSLNQRFVDNKYWDGNLGLLFLLSIPLLILTLILFLFSHWSIVAEAILSIIVLIYCIGAKKILSQFDKYIISIEKGEADAPSLARELINEEFENSSDNTEIVIMKSVFIESHRQMMATIFWYFLLGIVGVFLYRLVDRLHSELKGTSSGFSESTSILLNILEWPSVRLFAIGLALAGNLTESIAVLKKSEVFSIEDNHSLLTGIGIAALQYLPQLDSSDREKSYWLNQFKFLIIRTLVIWVVIAGIIILSDIS